MKLEKMYSASEKFFALRGIYQAIIVLLSSMIFGEIIFNDHAHDFLKMIVQSVPPSITWLIRPMAGSLFAAVLIGMALIIIKNQLELRHNSIRDALTGLYNRRFLEENLQPIFSKAARYGESAYLCFIDLDNFKSINDNFGHRAGDHALQVVAKTLSKITRKSDILARYGGDEFVIFWTSTDQSKSTEFIGRVRSALADITFFSDVHEISISGSIGHRCEPASDENALKEIFDKADAAMQQNKKSR